MTARQLLTAIGGILSLTIGLGFPNGASAQEAYPNRIVKVVVPQPGGSSADIIARVFTDGLSQALKQTFVIDNKAGANGIIATDFVAHAPADGYTLLFTYAAAQTVNQTLYKTARYDGAKDFAAIAQVGSSGNFLVVPPSMPINDLQQFIAYVKSRPLNEMSYGSWGVGSGGHLSMEVLKQKAGIQMQHVPYKSSIASLQDLMSGQIHAAFASAASSIPLINAGKLKAIALSAPTRSDVMPDVKTMTEQGVPFDIAAWYGFFAPAGTPPEIVSVLNKEINRMIQAPELQQQWRILGFDKMPLTSPQGFSNQVKSDIAAWAEIVQKADIKVD